MKRSIFFYYSCNSIVVTDGHEFIHFLSKSEIISSVLKTGKLHKIKYVLLFY